MGWRLWVGGVWGFVEWLLGGLCGFETRGWGENEEGEKEWDKEGGGGRGQ